LQVNGVTNLATPAVVLTITQAANKIYASQLQKFSMQVTQAQLTITADNKNWYYGKPEPKLTATAAGLQYNDKVTIPLTYTVIDPATNQTMEPTSPLGNYQINVTSTGTMANYTITYASGTMSYVASAAKVTMSPGSGGTLTFHDTLAGNTSAVKTVTLTNNTGANLTITAVNLDPDFTVVNPATGTSTCSAGRTLNSTPSNTCQFAVTFTPRAASSTRDNATLNFTITDPEGDVFPAEALNLIGYAVGAFTVSPSTVTLSAQNGETSQAAGVVTLTNNSDWPMTVGTATVTTKYFTVIMNPGVSGITNPCQGKGQIGSGHNCQIEVLFKPVAGESAGTTPGYTYSDTLTIPATSKNNIDGTVTHLPSLQVALNANDIPWVEYATTYNPLTFTATHGHTSAAQIITVTNETDSSLTIGASITPPFAVGSNSTCNSAMLSGGSCKIYVVFAPPSNAPPSNGNPDLGTLSISDGLTNPTFSLKGTVN